MIPLIKANGLTKEFYLNRHKVFPAVNDVSVTIFKGETLGLVGESGSGKSTLGRCLLFLEQPTRGEVVYDEQSLSAMQPAELFQFRRRAQMIFQDPNGALNPRMTIEQILAEPLRIHRLCERSGEKKKLAMLLDLVGLSWNMLRRYPHEFSGGQRQRIVIARALALDPQFIVCDEPLSTLDVSIQAQVVNLLKDLQKEFNLTYLFISHDLPMVKYMSDRIAVMHQGKIVTFQ